MHDDQIRNLLRALEDDRDPDPAFADALFGRLTAVARGERRTRTPFLLLAAALLLGALVTGVALGSGILRLPLVVDASATPGPSGSGVAIASPSVSATPSASRPAEEPSTPSAASVDAGSTLFTEADGLRVRAEPSADADIVATLRGGQLMGATGNREAADDMDWYEIRIGPGDLSGWVAAGPDGGWLRLVTDGAIAFHCENCGAEPALVSITPLGDNNITLIHGQGLQDWTWSPDGSRLAATIADAEGTSVAIMNPDGSGLREIGPGGYGPRWSPDGTRLAWSTGTDIVVTDEQLNPVSIGADTRNAGTPIWSPDGSRLAFAGLFCPDCPDEPIVGDPPSALYTLRIDGTDLRQLTSGGYDGIVGWSPDGSRLSGMRHDLSGEFPTRAFTIPVTGGEPEFLLDGGAVYGGASWSPDGTRMALFTPDGLVLADAEGANPEVLVPAGDELSVGEAHWSPSGALIVFGSVGTSAGTGLDLYLVLSDGSAEPRMITAEELASRQAEWQPLLAELP